MAGAMDLDEVTIESIRARLLGGDVTSYELVEAYLARIHASDNAGPRLNAIATINPRALEEAAEVDRQLRATGTLTGPLHGVPVVLKDNVETAGIRTAFGTEAAANNVPSSDAFVVKRLRAAGAIILAKSTMADFGASWFSTSSLSGLTRNPYALDRDSGGSSSGTAAAVAANFAAVGVGGDTGGSIRLPASFCNLVGLRVTPGLISRVGIAPLVFEQDTAGPLTRSVRDAAILLDALVGYDPRDSLSVNGRERQRPYADMPTGGLDGLRLGILTQLVEGPNSSSEVIRVFSEATKTLQVEGVHPVHLQVPELESALEMTSLYLVRSRADLDDFIASRPGIEAENVHQIYEQGRYHSALDLFEAIATSEKPGIHGADYEARAGAQVRLRDGIIDLMNRNHVDVLAFPDVQVPPPLHSDVTSRRWNSLHYPTNTVLAAQTGLPALSVPMGFTRVGLPVGLELVARPLQEHLLLRAGLAVETRLGARRRPNLGSQGD